MEQQQLSPSAVAIVMPVEGRAAPAELKQSAVHASVPAYGHVASSAPVFPQLQPTIAQLPPQQQVPLNYASLDTDAASYPQVR